MVPDPSQLGPYLLSDIGTPPYQFKKPKTPPPRTVVATTRMEMYMTHTSQDMVVTSPPGYQRSSSSSTSTGSRIPGPPQTSPRSSVQQWLDALDTPAPFFHPLQPYLLPNQCVCTQMSLLLCHLGTLLLRWQPSGYVAHAKARCHEGHALVTHRLRSCRG